MHIDDDVVYWLALNEKRGIIPHYLFDYIIKRFKYFKTFWLSTKEEMMAIGINSKDTDNFIDYANSVALGKYRDILNYIKKNNIKIIKYIDDEYPEILKHSGTPSFAPPTLLFRKGLKIDFVKSAAIVGSRGSSIYSLKKAKEFAMDLASKKFWIISGMAFGVDIEAHLGALDVKGGRTIAVLPWMDPVTPSAHEQVSKEIVRKGCLVSEKLFHTGRSMKYPFIERNRITSGLSDFLIAVESRTTGGTIRQVDLARAQKKPIFTLYPDNSSNTELMKGFRILVEKGAVPIISISDIRNLEQIDTVKTKYYRRYRGDPSVGKLIFGYDENDAIQRYIERSNEIIDREKIEIVKLGESDPSEEFFTTKYYLIINPKWEKDRPPCPRCGSDHVESRGHTWHCMKCNKYFKKGLQDKTDVIKPPSRVEHPH